MDPLFHVAVLNQTPDPERVIYQAMHQDYSAEFITAASKVPGQYGDVIIKALLDGNRGHYGPLEHPQITFGCGFFPHTVMQQARTHRVGVSFDVQCLAGDTEVTFVRASGSLQKITIADLYDRWVNGEQAVRQRTIRGRKGEPPGTYRRDCKKRLKKMNLRVLNEETDLFERGHLRDVMCSGLQPIYRLTLADGKTLDCTVNHRLYTSQGWQRMGEALGLVTDANHQVLAVTKACDLMTNGVVIKDAQPYIQELWWTAEASPGLSADQIAQLGHSTTATIHNWTKHHPVKILSRGKYGLKPINFQPILEPKYGNTKPKSAGRKLKAHPVEVVAVDYQGMHMTYDLEVDGPWHNFVANGVVVHNSFRYTGSQIEELGSQLLQDPETDVTHLFYVPESIQEGQARSRDGASAITTEALEIVLAQYRQQAIAYYRLVHECGVPYEDARNIIGYGIRQHFVVSFNCRSLMHFLDLRAKADAQLEIRQLCELMLPHFQAWCPHVAEWYIKHRWAKARLAP
ncbi:MAG: hypothetical protein OHK0012_05870 [Synechococcales cyanobacterium]